MLFRIARRCFAAAAADDTELLIGEPDMSPSRSGRPKIGRVGAKKATRGLRRRDERLGGGSRGSGGGLRRRRGKLKKGRGVEGGRGAEFALLGGVARARYGGTAEQLYCPSGSMKTSGGVGASGLLGAGWHLLA